MDPPSFGEIALRHRIIANPLSEATLDRIISVCDPSPGSRVLDVGCGKGEFLLRLAEQRDVRAEGIDLSERAVGIAEARARERSLKGTATFRCGDAKSLELTPGSYLLTACLGATHAFGGLTKTLDALRTRTEIHGRIVVGEGFWKQTPSAEYLEVLEGTQDEFGDHLGNVRTGVGWGLKLVDAWTSTLGEWEDFEDAYSEGIESYALENPGDPSVPDMLRRIRRWRQGYLRWGRETLGFGVYVFRRDR